MRRQSSARDRIHPRYEVKDVEGSLLQSSDIVIVDLSIDGVGIETHTALSVGRSYRLRVFRAGEPLDLVGLVAWSRLVRTEATPSGDVLPVYRAGLNFDQSRSEAASAWKHFVGSKLSVPVTSQLLGTLSPQDEATDDDTDDDTDEISIEFAFAVDVISLSGLRILVGPETDVQALLKKTLPIHLKFGEVSFRASARVLNFTAKGEGNSEGFFLGLQWVALSADNESILDRYISEQAGSRATPTS